MNEPYLHDLDLGEKLSDGEITRLLAAHADTPLLRAVLQRLRNEVMEYYRLAHDRTAEGLKGSGALKQGAARGLEAFALDLWLESRSDPQEEADELNPSDSV